MRNRGLVFLLLSIFSMIANVAAFCSVENDVGVRPHLTTMKRTINVHYMGTCWTYSFSLSTTACPATRTFKSNPSNHQLLQMLQPRRTRPKTQLNLSSPGSVLGGASLATSPIAWAIFHVVGGLVGLGVIIDATNPRRGWYNRIDLPSWTPPTSVFSPVWSTLYTLMGIAVSRIVATTTCSYKSTLVTLWLVRFGFTQTWAFIFFGAQRLRLGMIHNVIQWLSLLVFTYYFYQTDVIAGLLLLPYVVWQTFAMALNGEICKRNPTLKDGYNDAMLQAGISKLQKDAAAYAGIENY